MCKTDKCNKGIGRGIPKKCHVCNKEFPSDLLETLDDDKKLLMNKLGLTQKSQYCGNTNFGTPMDCEFNCLNMTYTTKG